MDPSKLPCINFHIEWSVSHFNKNINNILVVCTRTSKAFLQIRRVILMKGTCPAKKVLFTLPSKYRMLKMKHSISLGFTVHTPSWRVCRYFKIMILWRDIGFVNVLWYWFSKEAYKWKFWYETLTHRSFSYVYFYVQMKEE